MGKSMEDEKKTALTREDENPESSVEKSLNNENEKAAQDEDTESLAENEEEDVSPTKLWFMKIATWVLAAAILALVVVIFRMTPARTESKNSSKTESGSYTSEVTVPDLLGLTADEALEKTEALHIGLKFKERETSNEEEGTIIRTSPEAGAKVEENSTIEYTLSAGPESVRLAAYENDLYPDAVDDLRNRGFSNVSIQKRTSSSVDAGCVIRTKPAAGTRVRTDEKISVYVSIGDSEERTLSMPSLVGMTRAEALRTCARQGLFMKVTEGVSSFRKAGFVMGQSVNPGMVMKAGGQVEITVVKKKEGPGEDASLVDVTLGESTSYGGGSYRLVLVQTKDGITCENLCEKGQGLTFPHDVTVKGQKDLKEGILRLYEKVDGTYVSRASWEIVFP